MGIYTTVQTALDARLLTVVGLPQHQAENTLLDTRGKARTPFVRSTLIPSEAVPATVGVTGKNEYSGLYQVDLLYPMDAGKAAVNAMADLVVTAFARQTLSTIEVRSAWCEVGRQEGQYYIVPVIVRWRVRS